MINIEIICKGRGQGKTRDLILESVRTGTPILTAYDSRYIVQQAQDMGIKIKQPMTRREYEYFRRNGSLSWKNWNGKLLIDEVDGLLRQMLDADIETVTCTPDSMNEKENKNMVNGVNGSLYCSSKNGFTYTESSINLPNGMKVVIENGGMPKLHFPKVENVKIIVPNKVVEVTFSDGTKEKSVCREPDTFSLESAISICISKKIMGGSSAYNNAIKRGMKVYEKKLEFEKHQKEEQERIEKKRAKRLAYKERRTAKKREEQIAIQTEAYLRAMKAVEDSKNVSVNEENN